MPILKILVIITSYIGAFLLIGATVGGVIHAFAHQFGHDFPNMAETVHEKSIWVQLIISLILGYLLANKFLAWLFPK